MHILPYWNWKGREGEVTPIFVYTNYPSSELFINGKSQGRRSKNNNSLLERYRLTWMNVPYEPGEVKVVAFDTKGIKAEERVLRTAGNHIGLN